MFFFFLFSLFDISYYDEILCTCFEYRQDEFLELKAKLAFEKVRLNGKKILHEKKYYITNIHERRHLIVTSNAYIFCDGKELEIWTVSDVILKFIHPSSEISSIHYVPKAGIIMRMILFAIEHRFWFTILLITLSSWLYTKYWRV